MRGWLLSLLLLAWGAAAASNLVLEIDEIETDGLSLSGVTANYDPVSGAITFAIDEVSNGQALTVSDLFLACDRLAIEPPASFECEQGRLSLHTAALGLSDVPVSMQWQDGKGGIISLGATPLLGDSAVLEVHRRDDGWQIDLKAESVDLGALATLSALGHVEFRGTAAVHAELSLSEGKLSKLQLAVDHTDMAFQAADGSLLGEGLVGVVDLSLRQHDGGWEGELKARWNQGEALTPVAYIGTEPEHPLSLTTRYKIDQPLSRLRIESFDLMQRPWIAMDGSAELSLAGGRLLEAVRVHLPKVPVAPVFERYLAPILVHPLISALQLSGRAGGEVILEQGVVNRWRVEFDDLTVAAEDGGGAFAVEGLSGRLAASRRAKEPGEISWKAAHLFGFDLGETKFPLSMTTSSAAFVEPVKIPVLDGGLDIDKFAVDWSTTPPDVSFDGVLTPVSMEEVTRALNWIPMQGQLSGIIPGVSLRKGVLTVEGALLIRVFDGNVVIRDLSISDLFGFWPVLRADVQCENLDLEMLSGTYEFGRITGRIDGRVKNLRLENWRPVVFDARFETSPGDRSRHRISQKAVDNIASLSGTGVQGVLSRSFLRFFDEFHYDRLGIGCRLRNGVCEMEGVEPAKQGYYLVKGGGIPRIDVIGFNRATDWDVLVDRLLAITESGPPVVE